MGEKKREKEKRRKMEKKRVKQEQKKMKKSMHAKGSSPPFHIS